MDGPPEELQPDTVPHPGRNKRKRGRIADTAFVSQYVRF